MFTRLIRLAGCLALSLVSACALTTSPQPEQAKVDWLDYSASVLAMSEAEQEAVRSAAVREHETERTSDSAVRLAVVTMSLAQSTAELREALALTEYAAAMADDSSRRSFVSFLDSMIRMLLEHEMSLEQERGEKQALREQLDALRRLEQELNVQ